MWEERGGGGKGRRETEGKGEIIVMIIIVGEERGGDYMHVKLRGRGRTEVGEARSCHLS